jgi:pimeloyl-ACP methyl ester carboxylesterase
MLVFIHGLGGSVAQFHPLLTSFVNLSSCLAIDLPGCGLSSFANKSWDAYKIDALVELICTIIEDYREKNAGQGVVLIGHSLGCSLSALIASKNGPQYMSLSEHVVGLVAICPSGSPPSEHQVQQIKKIARIPGPIFDLWRRWDRRGGVNSVSVKRYAGEHSDLETRSLQLRFNKQSRTPVWMRMVTGICPEYVDGVPDGGLPGPEIWAGLEIPVFLVAGEEDTICKPEEIAKIASFMGKSHPVQIELDEQSEPIPHADIPPTTSTVPSASPSLISQSSDLSYEKVSTPSTPSESSASDDLVDDPTTPQEEFSAIPPLSLRPKAVLKTTILPSPASHALLYMPSSSRTLAGLISDFLCTSITPRLSLGWQLQFLSTAGKWDVKNLAKWQAVSPVSAPIGGIFRAMKTLREVDKSHCPEIFVREYGGEIAHVIDISHESPVYDPRGLERGGIGYSKLPTVSKIPPNGSEVREFISLVDRLREELGIGKSSDSVPTDRKAEHPNQKLIAVHCHYGFNRTGYFIVCYLIERCGYTVQEALDEFALKRPRGIRHAHFRDNLFVRYCVGLKRAPTI